MKIRYDEQRQQHQILVGKRWRKAEQTNCDNCGKQFYKSVSEINRYGTNFCSLSCLSVRRNYKRHLKSGKGSTIAKWCAICGARFTVKASKYKNYSTCDKATCRTAYRRKASLEYQRKLREAKSENVL